MNKRYLLFILALSLLLFSCGLNNTMYNARKYFKAAQARPLNANGKPSPQAVEEYTKTIQKCGIIITEHPNKKNLDDVVFLLSKALYYKANSAFQAKDQFEALIKGFPESKHYPEAHIYLARILRQINRPAESEALLEGFVRDGRYRKHHPKALLLLAEFEIEDKDYIRTQYWLQRIINEYPDTPEYKEAFFLFGKNFYEQQDYASSLSQFEKFVNTRGITKEQKMDARYYIALNLFELGELEKSSKMISSLLNDESRPEKIGQIRVLKARTLLASQTPSKGVEEVDDIFKTYPRSMSSSSAYYYLADYYFYQDQNIIEALSYYNKVKSDFPASPFVPISQDKAAALNQIKDSQNLSLSTNLQQYVDYHLLSAENYLNTFALPDSALLMYDRILTAPLKMKAELDSLRQEFISLDAKADSLEHLLSSLIPEMEEALEEDEEVEELESLDEDVEEVEKVEKVEDVEELESLDEDVEEVEKVEKVEDVEVLESLDEDVEEVEKVEKVEEVEELESLDEDVEEVEKVEKVEDVEELESLDELDELDEVDEVEEVEVDVDVEVKLDEDEDVEVDVDVEVKLDEDEDVEELESLDEDVEEVEKVEDDVEPEVLESLDELEDNEEMEEIENLEDELKEDETSASLEQENLRKDVEAELIETQTALASLDSKIKAREGNLTRMDNEFLPQVYFTKANLLNKLDDKLDALQAIQDTMHTLFPDNKYSNALDMLIAGEPVRLVDPEEDRQSELLDSALGFGTDDPDAMRTILEELVDSSYPELALRANFRLGWMYSFEVADTTQAKTYLNAVLAHPQGGEYAMWVRKFYNGTEFVFPKEEIEQLEDVENVEELDTNDAVIQEEESEDSEDAGQVEKVEDVEDVEKVEEVDAVIQEEPEDVEDVEELDTGDAVIQEEEPENSEEVGQAEKVEDVEEVDTDDAVTLEEAQELEEDATQEDELDLGLIEDPRNEDAEELEAPKAIDDFEDNEDVQNSILEQVYKPNIRF